MYIRKFYDPAATEVAATPRYEILREEISLEQAYTGFDDGKSEIKKEEILEEKKEEPIVEKAIVEEKKEEVVDVSTPPVQDWREVIQKQDPKEVYKVLNIDEEALARSKELAEDEFVSKLITYRKEHGNLTPFIEAATRDWDKVSPEQLIMDDLKKQYSHLSPEKAEKLAKSDYNSRFSYKENPELLDAENQEMAELVALKLESEVEKIRSARKEEQAKFLDSIKPIDRTAQQALIAEQQQEANRKEFELWKASIEANPAMVRLMTEKKITLGEKGKSFNYTVNPDSIKEKTLETPKFYNQFWATNESGQQVFNIDKWNRVAAYAENPIAFETALINHGMSIGTGKVVEELVNEAPKNNQQSQAKSKSLAKTFIEEGQEITLEQLYGG